MATVEISPPMSRLPLRDRLRTRAVSRNLCAVVNGKGPVFKHVKLGVSSYGSYMNCQSALRKRLIRAMFPSETSTPEEIAEIERSRNIALDDMARVMNSLKLDLDGLRIEIKQGDVVHGREYVSEVLTRVFKPKSIIPVKKIFIDGMTFSEIAQILSHVTPGKLEIIRLACSSSNRIAGNSDTFFHSEQFKKALELDLSGIRGLSFPIEHLFHLDRFTVSFDSISLQDVIKIRDVLLQSANFTVGALLNIDPAFNPIEAVRLFDPNYSGEPEGLIVYHAFNFKFEIRFSICYFIISKDLLANFLSSN